jgi:hypothetical protein
MSAPPCFREDENVGKNNHGGLPGTGTFPPSIPINILDSIDPRLNLPLMENRPPLKLWNPQAAVSWSLLLSPIFGAYIHAKNWSEIGELDEARRSKMWVYGGIIWAGLLAALACVPTITVRDTSPLGAIWLSVWFLTSAN